MEKGPGQEVSNPDGPVGCLGGCAARSLEELVVVGRRDPQNFTGGVVGVAVADAVAFGERAVEENEAGVVLAQALE